MDKDKIVVKENNNVPAKNGVLLADMDVLYKNSIELIQYARRIAVRQINLVQLMTFYSLGRWIVEVEQQGESRAKYGKQVIQKLSEELTQQFGKGFSGETLKNARKFYLIYANRISETVFSLFAVEKSKTVFSFFENKCLCMSITLTAMSNCPRKIQP